MNLPANLMYASTHEWIKIEGEFAIIGITDHAQELLGDVTFVELPAVGAVFEKDAEMGSVESVKAASEIYCPVAGEVVEINAKLDASPELLNSAPYTDGWLIKVRLNGTPSGLLSAEEYKNSL